MASLVLCRSFSQTIEHSPYLCLPRFGRTKPIRPMGIGSGWRVIYHFLWRDVVTHCQFLWEFIAEVMTTALWWNIRLLNFVLNVFHRSPLLKWYWWYWWSRTYSRIEYCFFHTDKPQSWFHTTLIALSLFIMVKYNLHLMFWYMSCIEFIMIDVTLYFINYDVAWLTLNKVSCCQRVPGQLNNAQIYRKTSSISRTKSQSLNVSCILAQLSSFNPLKPAVELRMKM